MGSMKKTFFNWMTRTAKDHPEFVFVKGDTAYIPDFQAAFPNQYLDVGIAEQNMTGVAAGMALEGKIPFTYSIINFATMRCLEQIRNDIAYHNLNVKIVSCGQGFDYGPLGATHHATEDIAIMRALPDMKVFCPCDPIEAEACFDAAFEIQGPCFIRNGHGGEPILHNDSINKLTVGKAYELIGGSEVAIFVSGSIAKEALDAAVKLKNEGMDVGVYSFPSIKPIDKCLILEKLQTSKLIVTVEEHNIIGGFGGAVAEIISEAPEHLCKFKRIGINDVFSHEIGSRDYLKKYYGIDSGAIIDTIREYCYF